MNAPLPPHPNSSSAVADGQVQKHYRILIVDDDDLVREGLVGYLENYHEASYDFTITASPSAPDARQKLAEATYHLVISDINMPEEDGFSLIQFIQKHYPQTRTAMITAYKVEDYVRNAKKTGVFNIIAKTAPFDFEELSTVVNNLLEPASAFGIETYMDPLAPLSQVVLRSSDDISVAFETLQAFLTQVQVPNPNDLLTAVIEAITNAVYHVAKLPDGSLKYEKGQRIERLEESEYVYIYYGQDLERIGIAIVDQGGRITADEIMYWLDRNISGTGLMDTHGRGMYLIHRLVDRLLVNIAPGQRTEIIMLNYRNQIHGANKPIYINQL
jgi:DNA-binding NarL/FixJ family response regulator